MAIHIIYRCDVTGCTESAEGDLEVWPEAEFIQPEGWTRSRRNDDICPLHSPTK